ncbi:MAG: hypothetical protein IPP17_30390 [Bacteroidetes bacterium]|nr:hypothetical protein [Bacteroidota bacterium]
MQIVPKIQTLSFFIWRNFEVTYSIGKSLSLFPRFSGCFLAERTAVLWVGIGQIYWCPKKKRPKSSANNVNQSPGNETKIAPSDAHSGFISIKILEIAPKTHVLRIQKVKRILSEKRAEILENSRNLSIPCHASMNPVIE